MENILKRLVTLISPLLLIPFESKLVNYLTRSQSLKTSRKSIPYFTAFDAKMTQMSNFHLKSLISEWFFNVSIQTLSIKYLERIDCFKISFLKYKSSHKWKDTINKTMKMCFKLSFLKYGSSQNWKDAINKTLKVFLLNLLHSGRRGWQNPLGHI